jgi:hypothetical protein
VSATRWYRAKDDSRTPIAPDGEVFIGTALELDKVLHETFRKAGEPWFPVVHNSDTVAGTISGGLTLVFHPLDN